MQERLLLCRGAGLTGRFRSTQVDVDYIRRDLPDVVAQRENRPEKSVEQRRKSSQPNGIQYVAHLSGRASFKRFNVLRLAHIWGPPIAEASGVSHQADPASTHGKGNPKLLNANLVAAKKLRTFMSEVRRVSIASRSVSRTSWMQGKEALDQAGSALARKCRELPNREYV